MGERIVLFIAIAALSGLDAAGPWGPRFLECEGPEFDPAWADFKRALALEAPRVRGSGASSNELVGRAMAFLQDWEEHEFGEAVPRFAARLAGASADEAPLDNYCLYGLIAAHFVAARHVDMEETGSKHVEDDHNMHVKAKAELARGMSLLAKKEQYDFLESTQWSVRSLDIIMTMQGTNRNAFQYYSQTFELPCQLQLGCEAALRKAEKDLPRGVTGSFASVVAVGMHITSTLEAVTAFRDALSELAEPGHEGANGMDIRYAGHPCPTHQGNIHMCDMRCGLLGLCDAADDDPIAEFITYLVDVETYTERVYVFAEAEERLQSLLPRLGSLSSAELILCTFPAILCVLLHKVLPHVPIFFVAIANPLFAAPGCVKEEDSTIIQCMNPEGKRYLQALRMMLKPNDTDLLGAPVVGVAAYAVTAALVRFQAGISLPLAGKAARYIPSAASWRLAKPSEVLLARSRFFDSSWGTHFGTVLREILELHGDPLTFVYQHEVGGFLSYEELAEYRAVIILPQDLGLHKFTEHYAMATPIWMPSKHWAYRLQRHIPWGMVSYAGTWWNGDAADLPHGGDGFELDFEPWFNAQHPPYAEVAYWYKFVEFEAYPHVQYFDSIPKLLVELLSEDLFAISTAMRRFRARLWRTTRAVYAGAGRTLLLAARSEEPGRRQR